MRNAVCFKSTMFNETEVRDYFINAGCFGDDVGEWVQERFEKLGYDVDEPGQEDWGWYLDCTKDGVTHTVNIGLVEGDGWKIFIDRRRSLKDRMFRRNTQPVQQFVLDLHTVLSCPDIQKLVWFYQPVGGPEEDYGPEPL